MHKNIVAHSHPKSPVSEAFRNLRTNIHFANIDKDIKTLLITSSIQSEGKSTVIINYAVTLAQSGKKVLLIDCDLRRPNIHKLLHEPNTEGLMNVLMREISFEKSIKTTKVKNLYAIVSGPIPPNPSEVLGSKRLKELIETLKDHFDMILIDAPPVMPVTDAVVLSNIADGTILNLAVGKTEKEIFKRSINSLKNVGANILGIVINKVPVKKGYYANYSYVYE